MFHDGTPPLVMTITTMKLNKRDTILETIRLFRSNESPVLNVAERMGNILFVLEDSEPYFCNETNSAV